jgi:hypothetical protein
LSDRQRPAGGAIVGIHGGIRNLFYCVNRNGQFCIEPRRPAPHFSSLAIRSARLAKQLFLVVFPVRHGSPRCTADSSESRQLRVGHRPEPMQNCRGTTAPASLDGLETQFENAPHHPPANIAGDMAAPADDDA